ncbi:uncharacterized protein NDAI_0K01650 [Naumovozyma dairenensis CBS 421]|uniref:Flo11 domain-containing protein n=1 Tax=Naumovozyma dairenensis (strain ATCC 10597 / BCRC 20456 / CBS 421 / NBRC 0211 / NRRL Y-12639) TaxID=1071378 RepID=G0WHU5_NAUDC|nr:hypothetical protein NDAI_0K01650 [Naumovozyma dairenensis CBS 421]CCD27356.1 hypothetical protein NDAI_0K01650 [Naumovozyma dairenensis CBS 421]
MKFSSITLLAISCFAEIVLSKEANKEPATQDATTTTTTTDDSPDNKKVPVSLNLANKKESILVLKDLAGTNNVAIDPNSRYLVSDITAVEGDERNGAAFARHDFRCFKWKQYQIVRSGHWWTEWTPGSCCTFNKDRHDKRVPITVDYDYDWKVEKGSPVRWENIEGLLDSYVVKESRGSRTIQCDVPRRDVAQGWKQQLMFWGDVQEQTCTMCNNNYKQCGPWSKYYRVDAPIRDALHITCSVGKDKVKCDYNKDKDRHHEDPDHHDDHEDHDRNDRDRNDRDRNDRDRNDRDRNDRDRNDRNDRNDRDRNDRNDRDRNDRNDRDRNDRNDRNDRDRNDRDRNDRDRNDRDRNDRDRNDRNDRDRNDRDRNDRDRNDRDRNDGNDRNDRHEKHQ